MAEAMGMNFDQPDQTGRRRSSRRTTASFTFGPTPTSPLDLANAYNTLGGQRHPVRPDARWPQILDRDGQPLTNADGAPVVTGDSVHPGGDPAGRGHRR